jgi:16S rRNA (cytosine967-C5)-methyltransferase
VGHVMPPTRRPSDAKSRAKRESSQGERPQRDAAKPVKKTETTARLLALDALVRIEEGAYAHILVPEVLRSSSLEDRDRAFVTELVYGTVRSQRRLDDLLERVSTRPIRRLDRPVRAALRLGAYQLLHDVAPHAAVAATVDAIAARSPRAKGFTNGVLRGLTRLGPPWPEPDDVATRLSYPDWLVARLTDDLGPDAAAGALAAMNEPAAVTLRPNRRAVTADALEAELRSLAIDTTRGVLVTDAMVIRGEGDPAKLDAVRQGRATPQDQASQAIVAVLAPRPGDLVADVGAAPGGKSGAIAERIGDEGLVVALDPDLGRLRMVASASSRLSLPSVDAVGADGRAAPLRPGAFDRVLLDAPCSGLGVLRRRADARWRISQDAIDELATLQRELLASAATLVKEGGTLVYSVCTLTDAETLAIDAWAAEHLPAFVAVAPPAAPWEAAGRGARVLPQFAGTDGMYVLVLQHVGAGPAGTVTP